MYEEPTRVVVSTEGYRSYTTTKVLDLEVSIKTQGPVERLTTEHEDTR